MDKDIERGKRFRAGGWVKKCSDEKGNNLVVRFQEVHDRQAINHVSSVAHCEKDDKAAYGFPQTIEAFERETELKQSVQDFLLKGYHSDTSIPTECLSSYPRSRADDIGEQIF